MSNGPSRNRLDRLVDPARDHVLGAPDADITLVEYGSYACPYCRAANERIAQVRDQLGERLRYVFRQRPLTGSDIARRAAELAERARTPEEFWAAHRALMTRSTELTEDDLRAVAQQMHLPPDGSDEARQARERVQADERSAAASGVLVTPTFFIDGRRYDGAWDESSFADALLRSPGHRMHTAALDFARWAPSTGLLLLLASLVAVLLANSPAGPAFAAFWQQNLGLTFADAAFRMPLLGWVNDALLTVFFLVVGLEIKREFTVGRLAERKSAALPIAAALGGMAVPALLYALAIPDGPWSRGWGVPMATDTAFAVALIAMLGPRVPLELRVFLTAAAIVDDIGAILVVALFYSSGLHAGYLAAAVAVTAGLALLNRAGVYRPGPYGALGLLLWACVHAGGLHSTLAGVVLAFCVPTRAPANLVALRAQADGILEAEVQRGGAVLGHALSDPALRALDAIHDRLQSPATRLLRGVEPWSSYVVLPLFALANAGVPLAAARGGAHAGLVGAIALGLVVGKPAGLLLGAALAVRLRLATKPPGYSWRQLAGAGALAGIGFTMSLFIAGQAYTQAADHAAAKIAVFGASIVSALIGVAVLWRASGPGGHTRGV